MISIMEHKLKKTLIFIIKIALAGIFWLGLWQLVYKKIGIDVILPSPAAVFKRLAEMLPEKSFIQSVFNSFKGIALGYMAGVLFGTVLGIITAFSKTLNTLFKPFFTAVKTTPVVSFIILALIWLEKTRVPVFITFLMVMPIVWANVSGGISGTDKSLIEMAKAYKFGFFKKLKLIYLPSAVPSFMTACETAVGLGWKAGIAAEVLCTPKDSIGINLRNAQIYIETVDLFAWTAAVIILSLVLEKALVWVLRFIFSRIMKKGGYFIENTNK